MGRRVEFDIALEPLLNDELSDPVAELARDVLFDDVLSVILDYFCFDTVLSNRRKKFYTFFTLN